MSKLAVLDRDGWELESGEERAHEAPDTFRIPSRETREHLQPGQIAKLIFRIAVVDSDGHRSERVERMWVEVRGRVGGLYRGELDNDPECTDEIKAGMEVFFGPHHVIHVWVEPAA